MKICSGIKCKFKGKPQPLGNFHKDKNQDDKHHKQCKQCRKDYAQSKKGQKTIKGYFKKKKKEIKQQQKVYAKTKSSKRSREISREKYIQKNPKKFKQVSIKARKKYELNNPIKVRARKLLGFAVANGKIIKPIKCSICDKTDCKIYGHHENYDKPLKVIWTCKECHTIIHSEKYTNYVESLDFIKKLVLKLK